MTNKKSTKKALLLSCLSLLLCCSMLIGTTFAWFTDSVSSVNNIIKAGNLDVNLYWSTDMSNWTEVDADTNVFSTALWEPGHTQVVYLKVVNEGTLALKYNLNINIASEKEGENVAGETFKLSDHIMYNVMTEIKAPYSSREAARKDAETDATKLNVAAVRNDELLPTNEFDVVALVVYMPETVGNEANYRGDAIPTINLGINLFATQLTHEDDSFGDDYDEDALVCDILATPETIDEILATVEAGTVIGLSEGYYDEIVLTQDNLTLVSTNAVVGFLNLNAKDGATIDGLTFDEAGAKQTYTFKTGNVQAATDYVANITGDTNSPKAADNIVIKNCTFTNTSGVATVDASEYIPIYFHEQGAATERATNITVDSCVFACNATQYIALNYLSVGNVVITNNTFGGGSYGTSHNTINATGNAANWTITGNSFNNWDVEKTAIGSSKQGSNTVTWTVTGNEFNHKDGAVILALKTSYTADNSVITVADNTVLDGNGKIVPTDVNAENETVYGGHKIQVNEGITAVTSTEELNAALTNNASVYLLAGDYKLSSLSGKENVTIVGVPGETKIEPVNSFGFGTNTTIKNVIIESESGNAVRYGYTSGDVVFENCEFLGEVYGFHVDNAYNGTITFKSCTFEGFNAFAATGTYYFNDCTFLHSGSYGHVNMWGVAYFNDCTWGEGATYGTRGDGIIYIDGVMQKDAATQEDLTSAITSGEKVEVELSAGEYTLPSVSNGDVTISGTADTVITVNKPNYSGSDVTFNGVTIKGSGYATGVQHVNTVTYNDATIVGVMCLYGEKVVFNNCTFDLTGVTDYIWTYGAKEVEFNNCTFNTNGKAILIYNEGADLVTKVTVKGCTFNATQSALASGATAAAIEIDSSLATNGHYTLVTENNTVDSDFSGEWRIKKSGTDNTTVNGVVYNAITIDGVKAN